MNERLPEIPEPWGSCIAGWQERCEKAENELAQVDEALARRPIVAEYPTRYLAICAAFEMASRTQTAEAMAKHWKFHYEKLKAEKG